MPDEISEAREAALTLLADMNASASLPVSGDLLRDLLACAWLRGRGVQLARTEATLVRLSQEAEA